MFWAVLRRPRLWGEAVRALTALAPRAWWASRPHLPIPDADYVGWRQATAYGDSDQPLIPADAIAYLEWRRRFRRSALRNGVASG